MFVYRPRWLPNGSHGTLCLAMTVLQRFPKGWNVQTRLPLSGRAAA